jgi:hypothetical protein
MRIISQFHDYYDGVQKYGQDQSVIYQRKTVAYETSKKDTPAIVKELAKKVFPDDHYYLGLSRIVSSVSSKTHWFYFSRKFIVFCGEVVSFLEVKKEKKGLVETDTFYFYSFESLIEYLNDNGVDISTKSSRWDKKTIAEKLSDFFDKVVELDTDWCIVNKVICALVERDKVTINPKLEDYQFYKVMDPHTCYQNLDMWISGTLAYPQNEMVELDDKYRIIAHGFDHKYAFRKEPEKK